MLAREPATHFHAVSRAVWAPSSEASHGQRGQAGSAKGQPKYSPHLTFDVDVV